MAASMDASRYIGIGLDILLGMSLRIKLKWCLTHSMIKYSLLEHKSIKFCGLHKHPLTQVSRPQEQTTPENLYCNWPSAGKSSHQQKGAIIPIISVPDHSFSLLRPSRIPSCAWHRSSLGTVSVACILMVLGQDDLDGQLYHSAEN